MVRRTLSGPCRVPRGTRLLVAVSGGADSTALLLALHALRSERDLTLFAAHLDHRLRGSESDADRRFVVLLCERLRIPVIAARWDVRRRMRRRGLGGEAGLRVLRREFLRAAARRSRTTAIATAHTADDQLETVLLRLLRGTGLAGLGGMRPRHGPWIKPLLEATRADIEADLRAIGQAWRTDSSNAEPAFARNRIRHAAIPALLAALEPRRAGARKPSRDASRARSSLARRVGALARELRSADRVVLRSARDVEAGTRSRDGHREAYVKATSLISQPRAVRWALYRSLMRSLPGRPGLIQAHLVHLDRLLRPGAVIAGLPGGFLAMREGDRVLITPRSIQTLSSFRRATVSHRPTTLRVPGMTDRAEFSLTGRWTTARRALERISELPDSEEYFAAEGIRGGLMVRHARADDVFVPFGRKRPVRLGDFLKKVPVRHRTTTPSVLADQSGILWVIGLRRSARAPVQPSSRRVLCVHVERHD